VRGHADRIAAFENDLETHTRECELAFSNIPKEEFPVDLSLVCIGMQERADENITVRVQELVTYGLGLVNVEVDLATRLPSKSTKPGIIKFKMFSKEDKLKALRCKRNLPDNGYRGVYIRSSMTHPERLIQQNFLTILKEIPNGDKYRVTANGRVVLKDVQPNMGQWARGPPVAPLIRNNITGE